MSRRAIVAAVGASFATALTMLVCDLLWLGVIARSVYDTMLGPLKRDPVFLPAALLFYAFYIAVIVAYAVLPSASRRAAAARGASMGLLAYATYELTNWAVLRDWPALLVPVDIVWGVVLTAGAAFVGKVVHERMTE